MAEEREVLSVPGVARISWLDDVQALYFKWYKTRLPDGEVPRLITVAIDEVERQRWPNYIVDLSEVQDAFKQADQRFMADVAWARLTQLSLKHFATVVPHHALATLSKHQWQSRGIQNGIELADVATLEDAKQWFRSKKQG